MDIANGLRDRRHTRLNANPANPATPSKSPKLGDFSLILKNYAASTAASTPPPPEIKDNDPISLVSPVTQPATRNGRLSKLFSKKKRPVLAGLQKLRSENDAAPSSHTGPVEIPQAAICDSKDTPHGPGQHCKSSISIADDDSPARDSDELDGIVSHESTPATSPATSVEYYSYEKSTFGLMSLVPGPTPGHKFVVDVQQPKQTKPRHKARNSTSEVILTHILSGNSNFRSWNRLCRLDRIRVARIMASSRTEMASETVSLPWDNNGNFFNPSSYEMRNDFIQTDYIEPLYCVNKNTKLQILRASLQDTYDQDEWMRTQPEFQAVANEPIHILVDLSNISIGFYGHLKACRFMSVGNRIRAPPFSFQAFTAAVERGRPCAKRATAGSVGAGTAMPEYMIEAANLGYEMNVLQRVRGTKKVAHNLSPGATNGFGAASTNASDSDEGNGQRYWREQGVDEILHLKMMQSLIDTQNPATIVLCTGDAAEAEFSDGFLKNVERALQHGWHVEVVGWKVTMASAWFDKSFQDKHGPRFRIFLLDSLVEELLALYGS